LNAAPRRLLAAAGAYFFLLCGYYMLRSLREAMALEAGRELIPVLFWLTFVAMLAILPLYWWLVARVPRRALVPVVYLPVVALFVALATLTLGGRLGVSLASTYFVAVTSFNLFLVSVFWSAMADGWRPAQAKRLYGFIAAGGSAGALAGPAVNALFVEQLGGSLTIYLACALIFIAAALAAYVQSTGEEGSGESRGGEAIGGRAIDDLARLVRSPYLLGIGGLIVAGQIIGAFTYNEQARYVEAAYTGFEARAALFARIDFFVNVFALLMQSVVVGWLTRAGGVRAALAAMPAIAGVSFLVLALVPTGAMLLATQVVRRAADYGLFKPAREMLFTVLHPDTKFKSKSLLDTLLQRGADSLGNALYLVLATLGISGIAWLCAAACGLLILCIRWLGAGFAAREGRAAGEARDGPIQP
jgi:ATP:ADP antiporter, AAA family